MDWNGNALWWVNSYKPHESWLLNVLVLELDNAPLPAWPGKLSGFLLFSKWQTYYKISEMENQDGLLTSFLLKSQGLSDQKTHCQHLPRGTGISVEAERTGSSCIVSWGGGGVQTVTDLQSGDINERTSHSLSSSVLVRQKVTPILTTPEVTLFLFPFHYLFPGRLQKFFIQAILIF